MAKNIEMNVLNNDGSYEVIYPEVINSETKILLGLQENATMDQVVNQLPVYTKNNIEPVGTVKYTIRDDLGDDWLLCDGSYFDAVNYPELGEMIPKDFTGSWNYQGDDGCPLTGPLYKMNGYYIRYDSSGVYYTDKWPCTSSDWTFLDSDTYFSGWSVTSFDYAAGKWVVGLYYSYSNPNAYAISNTSSINGTYTMTRFSKSDGQYRSLGDVFEYGGVAYAIGGYGDTSWYLRKISGTSLVDYSSCTGLQSRSSTNQTRYWSKIVMHNNILYAVHHNKASNNNYYYLRGQVSTDGGKNWTELQVLKVSSATSCNCFALGSSVYASLSNKSIYKINSSTGMPSVVTATGKIAEGYNVVEKDGNVFYASSNLYISNTSLSSASASSTTATDVMIGNDNQVYAINGTKYYRSSGTKVPKITADNCEVYIRAK